MIKKETIKITLILLLLSLTIVSCTEPYALQTNTFEDAIVVEATLTNELKKQEINLSRTYILEENGPTFETNAVVYVTDDAGNQYDYEEVNGKYVSTSEFQAIQGRNYQLHITTDDGKLYLSGNQKLTTVNPIETLNTWIETVDGIRGVQIRVNSFDPTNTSKYYRYTYEETSKVIAPKWNANEAFLLDNPRICYTPGIFEGFKTIGLRARIGGESKECYSTKTSKDIILTNTNSLSEDRVLNFPVRFISDKDYTIAERYSILVKQYVQSFESYIYFTTLKKIAGDGSVLSQNQPGFLYGNVKSATNPNEKVIGFFEVASVSEKRLFFNFNDVFPGEELPEYLYECEITEYDSMNFGEPTRDMPCGWGGPGAQLRANIDTKEELYYRDENEKYYMVLPYCGDCTTFSSNIKPTFWID